MSLSFVSCGGDNTFADSSLSLYPLHLNRLSGAFVDHLHAQISALVLPLAMPKARNNSARQLGLRALAAAVPKVNNLFRTLSSPEDRSSLYMVYVLAQSSLGEWLGEKHRLRSAIEKARESSLMALPAPAIRMRC